MTDKEKKIAKPRTTQPDGAKVSAPKATVAKRATGRSRVTSMNASHEQIASLAHRYWTERGGVHGSDTDDWLRAERELLGKAS